MSKTKRTLEEVLSEKLRDGRNRNDRTKVTGSRCQCDLCEFNAKWGIESISDKQGEKELARVEDLTWNFYDISDELLTIMISKNLDYGPDNILQSPGGAQNALGVRLYDKIARLNNLLSKDTSPNNESIRDTFVDIANYAIIGLLVTDNKWK